MHDNLFLYTLRPTVYCLNVSPVQKSVQISMSLLLQCVCHCMWKSCTALHNCLQHAVALVAALQSRPLLWRARILPAKGYGACLPSRSVIIMISLLSLLSFIRGIFFSLVDLICLICLDLNTLSFFYSSPTSPPVHCKQQRGKCSVSQAGPSVSSPHHRYLSVGF